MAVYPQLPKYIKIDTLDKMFDVMNTFANELSRELDLNDQRVESAPATKVYTVTSITEIGRPSAGDIAYSTSSSKFRGYTTTATGWVDFN